MNNSPITWLDTNRGIWLGGILVSVVLSWASINNQISLLNQKFESSLEIQKDNKTDIGKLKDDMSVTKLDIASIKQTLTDAKARGQISKLVTPTPATSIVAKAAPLITATTITPTPTSQQSNKSTNQHSDPIANNYSTTNNYSTNEHPDSNSKPNSPAPTATNPSPTSPIDFPSKLTGIFSKLIQ